MTNIHLNGRHETKEVGTKQTGQQPWANERRDRQPTSAMELRGYGRSTTHEILTKIEADFDNY